MCEGIAYRAQQQTVRVRFRDPHAALPVRTRRGGMLTLPWGRREQQRGTLPLGGWARLEAIHAGRWDRYSPKPVLLPISDFAEPDHAGQLRWYSLPRGQYIQGLVARAGREQRAYVVTVEPAEEDAIHYRWPRIITALR